MGVRGHGPRDDLGALQLAVALLAILTVAGYLAWTVRAVAA